MQSNHYGADDISALAKESSVNYTTTWLTITELLRSARLQMLLWIAGFFLAVDGARDMNSWTPGF
jgi:hypothetical protein